MQVDFYLLSYSDKEARSIFICRLIEKIYRQGHIVYIHCKDKKESEEIDELLWSFHDISFVPHCLAKERGDTPPPVLLGFDFVPDQGEVLINLSSTIPMFYQAFSRILEIIPSKEEEQAIAREHYQFYKKQKAEIKTHKIG